LLKNGKWNKPEEKLNVKIKRELKMEVDEAETKPESASISSSDG